LATILLIDDEESVRTVFKSMLERAGYEVLSADNGKHGLRLLEHQAVDLMLVDIFMPEMDGLELIPVVRKRYPRIKIISISGDSWKDEPAHHLSAFRGSRHTEEAVQSSRVAP